MEFFLKYKTVLLRLGGSLLFLIAFIVHFWMSPKEGVSEVEIAAANVARMEASVAGGSSKSSKATTPNTSKFLEEYKNTQQTQLQYLTIFVMILGAGFLGYSFIKPKQEE
ncbi:MAG: hypothetical protein PHU40_11720 [Sulfurimonas sp.]|nr:hypothetical protein [Sulfurimonas sp.]